jgi:hypothetical protein
MSPRSSRRRRHSAVLAGIGVLILGLAITAEFIGVEWWSSVDLKKLRQHFVIACNGHLTIGTRGTGGFFNRGIPVAGARTLRPRDYYREPLARRFVPHTHRENQTQSFSIPLVTPALLLVAAGAFGLLTRTRSRPHLCGPCGYDQSGLHAPVCPECGTLREP